MCGNLTSVCAIAVFFFLVHSIENSYVIFMHHLLLFFICIACRSQWSYHVNDCPTAITISPNWIRGYNGRYMGYENTVYEIKN